MNKDTIILLTACINPNGMPFTALQDKNTRLSQYTNALNWYLENTDYPIVFVENTNYCINQLFERYINEGRLECLTFEGNGYDKSLGKGFGEGVIIKYALVNSKLMKNKYRCVKITGRLIITNINELIKKSTDLDTIYSYKLKYDDHRYSLNSQFVIAPIIFWRDYFCPSINMINDSRHFWFEHLLYDRAMVYRKFKEFKMPLLISGVLGSTGIESKMGSMQFTKFIIKYYLKKAGIYYDVIKTSW